MIIPVGEVFRDQELVIVEKIGGAIRTKSALPVRFVPITRRLESASCPAPPEKTKTATRTPLADRSAPSQRLNQ